MIKIKKVLDKIYWVFILLLVLTAIATAFSIVKAPGGYRVLVVSSGSMEPTIKAGSVVLVGPQKEYKVGDVVTFLTDAKANIKMPNSTFTHRITAIQDDEGRKTYKTKGDANKTGDPRDITENLILGKTIFSIPYIGYLVAFTKTQLGFIALIVIPATLIIYGELLVIKKEAIRLFKERKKRKLTIPEKIEEKIVESQPSHKTVKRNRKKNAKTI